MIIRIARKEFISTLRDGRFRLMSVIILGLLLASFASGLKEYNDVRQAHESAQRETREDWLNQGEKNPHSAAHYGIYVFKPKLPLSFFDPGIDPYTGISVWLEAHKRNNFNYRPAQDTAAVERLGQSTASQILQLLLPLLIILFSFSSFAGERENGTWRQVLSIGVKVRDIALGKALGLAAALGVIALPAVIIGVTAILLATGLEGITPSLSRIVAMCLMYLLYAGIFLAISLGVSAIASSSRFALLLLTAFWIFSCLIVPKAVSSISGRFHAPISWTDFKAAIEKDIEQGIDGHNSADKRLEELKTRVLQQYGVKRVEDLPVNFDGIALQEGEEYTNQIFDRHYRRLWDNYEKQYRDQQIGSLFSPMLAVKFLSMAIAGTDLSQHRRFAEEAESYRRMLVKNMNDAVTHNSKSGDWEYKSDRNLWESIPSFSYNPPPLSWSLGKHVWSLVMLSLWAAVGIGLFSCFRRIKVTVTEPSIDYQRSSQVTERATQAFKKRWPKFARIMNQEWLNLKTDRTLRIITLIFAAIIGFGALNGAYWVKLRQAEIDRALDVQQKEMARLAEDLSRIDAGVSRDDAGWANNTWTVGLFRGTQSAIMPTTSVTSLSIGQADLYPFHYRVSSERREEIFETTDLENPVYLLFGWLDLAFVIIYLYPLIIIALSYNLLSAERELGTLALIMSQPVTLRSIVIGKLGLRALVVFFITTVFCLLSFLLIGLNISSSDVLLKLGFWIVLTLAYGAFWFSLSLAVCVFGRGSATNAVALVGLWIAIVVVMPSLLGAITSTLYPVPSRAELVQANRRASDEAWKTGSQMLARYYEDHPELLPEGEKLDLSDYIQQWYVVQGEISKSTSPIAEQYKQQLVNQQETVSNYRFLSAAVVLQEAMNDLAGTGLSRYRHFLYLVDQLDAEWKSFFYPRAMKKLPFTSNDFQQMPRFKWVEESVADVTTRASIGLTGLLLPTLLIGLSAIAALGRRTQLHIIGR